MAFDALSQFDGQGLPEQEVPAQQPEAEDQGDTDAGETAEGYPESDRGPVPYSRYDEANQRLRELERRNDELMRVLLAERMPGRQAEPEEDVDPEVEKTVEPILRKHLKGVDEVMARQAKADQMSQLEELSPGITKIWPQLEKEYNKIPAHLQPDFNGIAGALALRARIEARRPKAPSPERQSHTDAGASSATRTAGAGTPDISTMTRAQFDAYVKTIQGAKYAAQDGGGYDPLIR